VAALESTAATSKSDPGQPGTMGQMKQQVVLSNQQPTALTCTDTTCQASLQQHLEHLHLSISNLLAFHHFTLADFNG